MKSNVSNHSILFISSRADPAGSLIHEEVLTILDQIPDHSRHYQHLQVQERLIYLDGSSFSTNADLIIFLSRHASVEPRPVLTVHVTGNYGPASYGGDPGTLTPAATSLMHAIMNNFFKYAPDGYAVTYEATHHGPTSLPVPSCFVEIGSTEKEWNDRVAAAAVARSVLEANPIDVIPLVGFGGTHYAKRQTEITLTTRGGFGHIMPTRDLGLLTKDLFTSIIHESGAEAVYIDKKAVAKEELRRIEDYSLSLDIPVIGQTDLQTLGRLSFDTYKKIIQKSKEIIPGSTITLHNPDGFLSPQVIHVSSVLVEEVIKVAPDQFFRGLDKITVAHLSGNGISCHSHFIADEHEMNQVVKQINRLCIKILTDYYQDLISVSDSIVSYLLQENDYSLPAGEMKISERRFDPALATKLGVTP